MSCMHTGLFVWFMFVFVCFVCMVHVCFCMFCLYVSINTDEPCISTSILHVNFQSQKSFFSHTNHVLIFYRHE